MPISSEKMLMSAELRHDSFPRILGFPRNLFCFVLPYHTSSIEVPWKLRILNLEQYLESYFEHVNFEFEESFHVSQIIIMSSEAVAVITRYLFSCRSSSYVLNPLSANSTKWSSTLKQSVTKCLSVFDHFVGLVLKGSK